MKHPKFAKRFNEAVALAGVESTQKALSKLLGVSEVMIWSYRNGEKLPRMAMALKMADEFGVSVDWLLQGRGDLVNRDSSDKSPTYKSKPLRKSTKAIVDLVETLTESERKKALKLLNLTFKNR